jgi:hypothetical protein
MTEIFLVIALLGQNVEAPATGPHATPEKAAEPAPAPVPAAASPVTRPSASESAGQPTAAAAKTPVSPSKKPTSAPAFAAVTEGMSLMPYWGLNSALGAPNYAVGQRMGVFLGWNVSSNFAFSAELSMDVLDANAFSATSKPSDKLVAIAAIPLVRLYSSRSMWAFGPSVGFFGRDRWSYWADSGATEISHVASRGFVMGLTLGAFVPVGRVALGGLASIRVYAPTRTCTTTDNVNIPETCGGRTNDDDTKVVTGLAGAVLF